MRILAKRDEQLQGIKHFFVSFEREEEKVDALCDLFETLAMTQSIMYVNTRTEVCAARSKFEESYQGRVTNCVKLCVCWFLMRKGTMCTQFGRCLVGSHIPSISHRVHTWWRVQLSTVPIPIGRCERVVWDINLNEFECSMSLK